MRTKTIKVYDMWATNLSMWLVQQSIPFIYEPLPDDWHEFTVKEEAYNMVRAMAEAIKTPRGAETDG